MTENSSQTKITGPIDLAVVEDQAKLKFLQILEAQEKGPKADTTKVKR
jgi:hypothetical protein